MTWYFDPHGTQVDVYDHTGTRVAQDVEVEGGQWSGRFPRRAVFGVMYNEAVDSYNAAGGVVTDYVLLTLAEATFEEIEEGTPP